MGFTSKYTEWCSVQYSHWGEGASSPEMIQPQRMGSDLLPDQLPCWAPGWILERMQDLLVLFPSGKIPFFWVCALNPSYRLEPPVWEGNPALVVALRVVSATWVFTRKKSKFLHQCVLYNTFPFPHSTFSASWCRVAGSCPNMTYLGCNFIFLQASVDAQLKWEWTALVYVQMFLHAPLSLESIWMQAAAAQQCFSTSAVLQCSWFVIALWMKVLNRFLIPWSTKDLLLILLVVKWDCSYVWCRMLTLVLCLRKLGDEEIQLHASSLHEWFRMLI